MNFDHFANTLKSHAEAAARSLNAFDEMAAQDEYIHHDSLNVKHRDSSTSNNTRDTQPIQSNLTSTTAKSPPRSALTNQYDAKQNGYDAQRRTPVKNSMQLLSIVADTLSQSEHATNDHNETDSREQIIELDDSDEDVEDDPILKMIRKSPERTKARTEESGQPKAKNKEMEMEPLEIEQQRNRHRFMDDLERRVSLPQTTNIDNSEAVHETSSTRTNWFWGNSPQTAKNVAATKMAPLSRKSFFHRPVAEKYDIVASTDMLGDEEMQALAQLKESSSNSVTWTRWILSLMWGHPRESFVALTFLIGICAYYYSRWKTL